MDRPPIDSIEYEFERDTYVQQVRLIFDSDLNRRLPKTLITEYRIECETERSADFS